mgnify:CR=1 FL=1
MDDKNDSLIIETARSLGEIGDLIAIPRWIETFKKWNNNVVRKIIAQALGKIGTDKAIEALEQMAQNEKLGVEVRINQWCKS